MLIINNGISTGVSGGDLHSAKVATRWARLNDVYVCVPEEGRFLFQDSNVKGAYFQTPFQWNRFCERHVALNSMILYLIRTIQSVTRVPKPKFHVIIASSNFPHDVIPALFQVLMNGGGKLIVYDHESANGMSRIGIRGLVSDIYCVLGTLLSAKLASRVFVLNREVKSRLEALGVQGDAVVITGNGIDSSLPLEARPTKRFDACFLGSMRKAKGITDLVDVWEEVCKRKPHALLAVVGGGEQDERASDLVAERNLTKNILLLGWQFGYTRFEVLRKSKLFVFPSYFESWGLAVAEAMSCGLPVVAYDLQVYREVFDGNVLTVPIGDTKAMARKVISLLDNPDLAKEIGEANVQLVEKYDWNRVASLELSSIASLLLHN